MERRKFIKNSCSLCMAVAGGSILASFLDSCSSIPLYKTISKNRKISIPLDQFTKNNFLIVRPTNLTYDIAVIKIDKNQYKSLVMQCTHADNPLRFNGIIFTCDVHGSIFDRTGNVEKGPAERALLSLKTEIQNDQLIVMLI